MAEMIPPRLVSGEVKSRAELKVFEALQSGLGDDWLCIHSAAWLARDPARGAVSGEIDFVLCHPEAIVCLEVKGGGLACRHGEWFRIEEGRHERMRDPFEQAMDGRYALSRMVRDQPGWGGEEPFVVHALSFPDISVHALELAPDAPMEIVIDRNGIREIDSALERVLAYHRGARDKRKAPDVDGVAMVRGVLAPEVLIEVPMAERFLEEEAAMVELTHEQASLLGRFGRERRMVVHGCAGSGKTMLAVEQAKRRAGAGEEVGFVCFNRALRDHLRRTERRSSVAFHTFHGLCLHLAKVAGVHLPEHEGTPPEEYWNEELPAALPDAVEVTGPPFDALFVDEAQDLHNHWLTALQHTLRDPDEGMVWLFTDDNQRIYQARLDVPSEFRPFDLTWNCRNTQAIHREVLKRYSGEVLPEARGPEGREVEYVETDDQAAALGAQVERLCGKEEVPCQDVVVLSSHALERSSVAEAPISRWRLVRERSSPLAPEVLFSSIRAFKGLESPVVILCELEDLDEETRDQQIYVAMSRARNHCVVIGGSREAVAP